VTGIVDLHVHAAPSLVPRHGFDPQVVANNRDAVGVAIQVLKAHEGSSAERAQLCGEGVYGGIVLNSSVGGANPDAVEVACRLGGRIVWMPTVSSHAHKEAADCAELVVHRSLVFRTVPVVEHGRLVEGWDEVFDVVAHHDVVLASGHLTCEETLVAFRRAHEHGVRRFLVNHPFLPFLNWDDELIAGFVELGARLELGIVPDLLSGGRRSIDLARTYPQSLLVFGSDTGHADFPTLEQSFAAWAASLEELTGRSSMENVLGPQGRELIVP
jgi:hypothetical protein